MSLRHRASGPFRKLARQMFVSGRRGRRLSQPHDLHGQRRRQAEIQFAGTAIQHRRRPQDGKLVAEFLVVVQQSFQVDFALLDLLAELLNLVFLPDESHRGPGEQETQAQRLQRRSEPDCR
jgi:hypothetical protein